LFSSVLLVAGRPDLSSWHLLFSRKNMSPTCNLLFSSQHYPRKLALSYFASALAKFNKKFNVRSRQHTKTHSDNNRRHSERDCHRTTTTKLWNADMPPSSNHTEVSVHCCHGKHTVARSRTLLSISYDVAEEVIWSRKCNQTLVWFTTISEIPHSKI
jgi:hypothetical protein